MLQPNGNAEVELKEFVIVFVAGEFVVGVIRDGLELPKSSAELFAGTIIDELMYEVSASVALKDLSAIETQSKLLQPKGKDGLGFGEVVP